MALTDKSPVEEGPSPETETDEAADWWEEAWKDCWESDRLDAVGWALAFLWGAVVVLADNAADIPDDYSWWDPWGVFFIGAGVITLVGAVVRMLVAEYRSSWGWSLIWGTVFLCIGLATVSSPAWYALLLVSIAFVILVSTFAGGD